MTTTDDNNTETAKTEEAVKPPVITHDLVKADFNVELTKQNLAVQLLQNEVDAMEYTEDNLPKILELITRIKKIQKVIDDRHAIVKAPYLKITQLYDTVKREFTTIATNLLEKPQKKYKELCEAIEDRKKKQEAEQKRVNDIKDGINNNILKLSQDIAAALTAPDLVKVEKLIGLEKTRTGRYQEFMPEYIQRLDGLNDLLKQQKTKVKDLEELEKQRKDAEKNKDDETVMALDEKKQAIVGGIEDDKVKVQEHAINTSTGSSNWGGHMPVATEVLPQVKAKRSVWKWKVEDMKVLQKAAPHLVKVVTEDEKIDELLKSKKAEGAMDGKEEVKLFGITFYLEKTYS